MDTSILAGKTILIVDDYAINSELLSFFVTDAGAIPFTAANGQECLDIVATEKVDMILMDSNMPVMNGIEATRAIRALPEGDTVVIVGISVYDDDEEADLCLKAGMNALSPKLTLNEEKLIEIGNLFFTAIEPQLSVSLPPAASLIAEDKSRPAEECSVEPGAVMEFEKALEEFENDRELLESLMRDFNRIIHEQFVVIQTAFDNGDTGSIQRESHGIKGGAANLCARPLSAAAQSVEYACRQQKDSATISALLHDLEQCIDNFDHYVQKYFSGD